MQWLQLFAPNIIVMIYFGILFHKQRQIAQPILNSRRRTCSIRQQMAPKFLFLPLFFHALTTAIHYLLSGCPQAYHIVYSINYKTFRTVLLALSVLKFPKLAVSLLILLPSTQWLPIDSHIYTVQTRFSVLQLHQLGRSSVSTFYN